MNHKQILGLVIFIAIFFVGCKQKNPMLSVSTEISSNCTFRQADKGEWLPATVSGCVHTYLLANGKIEELVPDRWRREELLHRF